MENVIVHKSQRGEGKVIHFMIEIRPYGDNHNNGFLSGYIGYDDIMRITDVGRAEPDDLLALATFVLLHDEQLKIAISENAQD